ncbi:unnamed protein product [Arabis nemorensis]|uniref:Geranylgeranyl transferase type-2 subunit alpha n=1 Tax=Arabis nemorensis TaxID=586526 RepID=A0A565CV48_9BRAS|nr:unnamed protein product [Arabis nemorensis]
MHGCRRKQAPTPEEEAASAAKGLKVRSLQSQFISNHHQKSYTQEAIQLSVKLLEINLEAYTAWNYRKLAVEDNLSRIDDSDPSLVNSILEEELEFVEKALERNAKFYRAWNFHAWNYRRFVVELTKMSEQDELQYTTDMINNSFSNYSAWHNRRYAYLKKLRHLLTRLMCTYFKFTRKKADGFMPEETIRREYDYVHDAIFTDENDQSAWFYYLWLFDQTVKMETPLLTSSWPSDGSVIILSGPRCFNGSSSKFTTSGSFSTDSKRTEPCFRKENKVKVSLGKSRGIVSSRGCNFSAPYEFVFTVHIHDTVGESQEGILSWTGGFDNWDAQSKDLNSLIALDQLNADTGFEWRKKAINIEIELFRDLPDSKVGKLILARLLMAEETIISDDAVKGVHYREILELYNDLMALDSSHEQYYKDEHSVALLHKVTSSTESLSKHLFRYRNMNNIVCLRLNNLTLSRIAAVEKLLFVQMLDLSHNELHSAEESGAFQRLTLSDLKQLRVLDVSHNHIGGEQPVDTTRYLCSSSFSNSGEIGREVPSKYRDAYLVVRDLVNLKQLDIRGNDLIAGEEFSSFARQVVPELVWPQTL